jgi:hypothetical protein
MNLSNCDTWRVEWGPGSPRPDHFMVYHYDGDGDQYMGTFLTLSAAIKDARSKPTGLLEWDRKPALTNRAGCKREHEAARSKASRPPT